MSRLSLKATTFLAGKGFFETSKDFSIIRIFGCEEKPFLLPFYVLDKHFVVEVCRKYKTWDHFFNEKRKKQFIPFPWKVGEITVKHISHLDELVGHFDQLSLKETKLVEVSTLMICLLHIWNQLVILLTLPKLSNLKKEVEIT
jgi:hypothetical protein